MEFFFKYFEYLPYIYFHKLFEFTLLNRILDLNLELFESFIVCYYDNYPFNL